jgi:hypothetical protein
MRWISVPVCCWVGVTCGGALRGYAAAQQDREEAGVRSVELKVASPEKVGFNLLRVEETGLAFTNLLDAWAGAANRVLYNGSGVAAGDFDRDGRIDIAVSQNAVETKLYRNVKARSGSRVRLAGAGLNPDGIGAVLLRLRFGEAWGPAHEVHAGSGYLSQDGAILVLGTNRVPSTVWVRWPGGQTTELPVPLNTKEITVEQAREGFSQL